MKVSDVSLKTTLFTLRVTSKTAPEFIDVTDRVAEFVRESGIRNGMAVVFSRHTTVAVTIQENEPLLLQDMADMLDRLSPRGSHYRHNDFDIRTVHMHQNECPNGHSHCQHLTLGSSETIPVIEGVLALGQWQRVFMVELDDGKVGPREVLLQIIGV